MLCKHKRQVFSAALVQLRAASTLMNKQEMIKEVKRVASSLDDSREVHDNLDELVNETSKDASKEPLRNELHNQVSRNSNQHK